MQSVSVGWVVRSVCPGVQLTGYSHVYACHDPHGQNILHFLASGQLPGPAERKGGQTDEAKLGLV